ncbi:MAG: hypothetical protein K5931_01360 [Lachnospiraceae bacterium]|nr:hypothetical protein [Lachnospiraceae bacterium]
MKNRMVTKICAVTLASAMLVTSPLSLLKVSATESQGSSSLEDGRNYLLSMCLLNIYRARAEETRVAREFLGQAKYLASVNPSYASQVTVAEDRLNKAIYAENVAKSDYERQTAYFSSQAYGTNYYNGIYNYGNYYNASLYSQPAVNAPMVSYVHVNTTDQSKPGSTTIPVNSAARIVLNGNDAFSIVNAGMPSSPSSMMGLLLFNDKYASYQKWKMTIRCYDFQNKLMDTAVINGQVKNSKDFKKLNNFVQIWRLDLAAVTITIDLSDSESVMVAWNTNGTVTVTDIPRAVKKNSNSSSGNSSKTDSSNSSSSDSSQSSSQSSDSSQGSSQSSGSSLNSGSINTGGNSSSSSASGSSSGSEASSSENSSSSSSSSGSSSDSGSSSSESSSSSNSSSSESSSSGSSSSGSSSSENSSSSSSSTQSSKGEASKTTASAENTRMIESRYNVSAATAGGFVETRVIKTLNKYNETD